MSYIYASQFKYHLKRNNFLIRFITKYPFILNIRSYKPKDMTFIVGEPQKFPNTLLAFIPTFYIILPLSPDGITVN